MNRIQAETVFIDMELFIRDERDGGRLYLGTTRIKVPGAAISHPPGTHPALWTPQVYQLQPIQLGGTYMEGLIRLCPDTGAVMGTRWDK